MIADIGIWKEATHCIKWKLSYERNILLIAG